MLTGDLVRPRLRIRGEMLSVDLLQAGGKQRKLAAGLIALLRQHAGQPRQVWEEALEAYEGERIDYIVIRGLAKVLIDNATLTPIEPPIPAPELREHLFAQGPVFTRTDLFHQQTRQDVVGATANDLGLTPQQVEATLFADRPSEYILTDTGPEWTPDDLIARYNLELARGVLYWASEMRVDIHDGYKDFWRYLKLFKLMFWATPKTGGGYQVTLDGPISPFVKSTTRYGRQFAAFLPALLLSDNWRMVADVYPPQSDEKLRYCLDHTTPLRTHFKRSGLFDSQMEADFAAEFQAKFGDARGPWQLSREDEVLLLGDTVMIPDFALTHQQDGRRVLIEIIGFWHPEYLRRKLEKIRMAGQPNLLLLVYEGVNLTDEALQDIPAEVLYFKNKPVLKDVMAVIEQVAK